MAGKTILITAADGDTFAGYLATPASGSGPGLILLQEIFGVTHHLMWLADLYAEEGWVTLAPDLFWRMQPGVDLGYSEAEFKQALDYGERMDVARAIEDIGASIDNLRARPECNGKVGAIGFCLGGKLAYLAAARCDLQAAVGYYGVGLEELLGEAKKLKCPALFHFAGDDHLCPPPVREKIRAAMAANPLVESYVYPGVQHGFNNRDREQSFDSFASTFAHTRTLDFMRRAVGPRYDLAELWDRHRYCEFGSRSADETMRTMVPEPYVNHVPTMTGGYGFRDLHRFYKHHFIPTSPRDISRKLISRTIQGDRLIEEFVSSFTHDVEIDWMLPGIPPTGKRVEIPMVVVVQFRGDKLYNEHIYWDQASVLVQLGLIDSRGLPVAGAGSARKMLDQSLPANTLMPRWKESEHQD